MLSPLLFNMALQCRWFEPSTPTEYLRWKKDWHLASFSDGQSSPSPANGFPGCQRLTGGFGVPSALLFVRPVQMKMSMTIKTNPESSNQRVSATRGPIHWIRSRSGHKNRSHSGHTVVGSTTLKRSTDAAGRFFHNL